MSELYKTKVGVNCAPGGYLPKCIIEAIVLSATNECNIEMNHNDRIFLIKYEDIVNLIDKIEDSVSPKSEENIESVDNVQQLKDSIALAITEYNKIGTGKFNIFDFIKQMDNLKSVAQLESI